MSELENIDNVEEVETIPTGEVSGEVSGEVTEVPEDNSAEIEAEQERLEQERLELERQQEIERQEAEERAREQARIEHENFLKSFPETTVFYQELKEEGDVKWLCGTVKDAHTAESYGWLDNHYDESELTYIGTPECGTWYLKGYEKPEPTEEEKMKLYAQEIERQIDEHLQELASSRGYDDVKSCVGYFNSTDETFQKEARAMTVYRDHLYRTGYNIIEKCQKGEIDYHVVTLEYVLSLIDPIEW